MNKSLFWFRLLVALGGIANLAFAIPALFAPEFLARLIDTGNIDPNVWLRNVGILLIILSSFYILAIRDPFRYLFNSVALIVGRFLAGVFFLILVLRNIHFSQMDFHLLIQMGIIYYITMMIQP